MSILQHKAAVPAIIVALTVIVGGVAFFRSGTDVSSLPNASTLKPNAPLISEAQAAESPKAENQELITPRILGNPDAPVTIIEYASLTCPHCAEFHRETFPELKTTYIDTGKVKLEYRDYPLNEGAALGALLARCAPEDRYFPLISLLFAQQPAWGASQNMLADLAKLGSFAGMTSDSIEACFNNQELYAAIVKQRSYWSDLDDVGSTPTFIVNGTKIVGAQPFEKFKELIDADLN
ncbi:MAG: DsbA family protein [Alphaproteobacteria bacterium]|nr:DsbA family protein [Alphaproteobacteria bacterium]